MPRKKGVNKVIESATAAQVIYTPNNFTDCQERDVSKADYDILNSITTADHT